MAAAWRSKWLDWQPGDKNISNPLENGLTKPTKLNFVSSVSSNPEVTQIISTPEHEPAATNKNIRIYSETELTKLSNQNSVSFVSSNPENDEIISGPEHDPEAWRIDFCLWLSRNAIHREGYDDSGGIQFLWVDFCDWAITHESVPCLRSTLERLLIDAGYELRDGMVLGLILRSDLKIWREMDEFARRKPPASEAETTRSVIRPRRRRS
jgi:hypothetical protein